MIAIGSRLGLDRLSIKSRILGGFAVVLVLLVVLAAISIRGSGIVERQSANVEDSANVAGLMGALPPGPRRRGRSRRICAVGKRPRPAGGAAGARRAQGCSRRARRRPGKQRPAPRIDRRNCRSPGEIRHRCGRDDSAIGDRRTQSAGLGKAGTELRTIVSAIATALVREKAASEMLEKGMRLTEAFHTSNTAAIAAFSRRATRPMRRRRAPSSRPCAALWTA